MYIYIIEFITITLVDFLFDFLNSISGYWKTGFNKVLRRKFAELAFRVKKKVSKCYPNLILLKSRKSYSLEQEEDLILLLSKSLIAVKITKTAAKEAEVLNNRASWDQNGGSSRYFVNLVILLRR